jgi:hypothetical protein
MPKRRSRGRARRRRRFAALVALVGACTAAGFIVIGAADGDRDLAGTARRPVRPAGIHGAAAPVHRRATRAPRPPAKPLPTLRPGSDPAALPGPVLIADKLNNRLLEVSPRGRIRWLFPRRGDLAKGQTFLIPDDAFFSRDGRSVIATQEDDFTVSRIDLARHRIAYRYGVSGTPGSTAGRLYNPDDALFASHGRILLSDIKNCRLVVIRPPAHVPASQLGMTGNCVHAPPTSFAGPNGAFPMANGDTVVTEINGDWIDVLSPAGKLVSSAHPPGFSYPSDTNEVSPGRFLSVDYTTPGAIETFDAKGKLLWRFAPRGANALEHPSLALPLPNGDIIANDDYNDRVIVIDPRTNRIVWQYGHTGVAGSKPGYLNNPDGVDLAGRAGLLRRFPPIDPP